MIQNGFGQRTGCVLCVFFWCEYIPPTFVVETRRDSNDCRANERPVDKKTTSLDGKIVQSMSRRFEFDQVLCTPKRVERKKKTEQKSINKNEMVSLFLIETADDLFLLFFGVPTLSTMWDGADGMHNPSKHVRSSSSSSRICVVGSVERR
jgi:hypothetical protein